MNLNIQWFLDDFPDFDTDILLTGGDYSTYSTMVATRVQEEEEPSEEESDADKYADVKKNFSREDAHKLAESVNLSEMFMVWLFECAKNPRHEKVFRALAESICANDKHVTPTRERGTRRQQCMQGVWGGGGAGICLRCDVVNVVMRYGWMSTSWALGETHIVGIWGGDVVNELCGGVSSLSQSCGGVSTSWVTGRDNEFHSHGQVFPRPYSPRNPCTPTYSAIRGTTRTSKPFSIIRWRGEISR